MPRKILCPPRMWIPTPQNSVTLELVSVPCAVLAPDAPPVRQRRKRLGSRRRTDDAIREFSNPLPYLSADAAVAPLGKLFK